MIKKLAAFLFAIGCSAAFAYPAGSFCETMCYRSSIDCAKHLPMDVCQDVLETCLAGCDSQL